MKKAWLIGFIVALTMPYYSFGKGNMVLSRGGLGFLFPDHNSFSNPGQLSINQGAAVELKYNRFDGSDFQGAGPSFVFGNGRIGLGGYAYRLGTALDSSANSFDSVGGGIGLAMFKRRLTLGVSYDRSIDIAQTSDGTFAASINMNAGPGKGPAIGVGFDTSVNQAGGDTKSGKVGIGWAFGMNRSFELLFRLNDLDDTSNYGGGGYITYGGNFYYLSGGYEYTKLVSDHKVLARLGLILAGYVDFSVMGSKVLETGGETLYGATLRACF